MPDYELGGAVFSLGRIGESVPVHRVSLTDTVGCLHKSAGSAE
jgi:hypothetical protein